MKSDVIWYLVIYIVVCFFSVILSYAIVEQFYTTDDYVIVWTFSHIMEFLVIVPLFIRRGFTCFKGVIKIHYSDFLTISFISVLLSLSMSLFVGSILSMLSISEVEHEEITRTISNRLFPTILICTTVPILEEIVFRGAILRRMLESKEISPIIAIILSAIIFGFSHLNIYQFLSGTIVGILLGWIFYRVRNLYLTIVVHSVFNTVVSVGSFFSDSIDETRLTTSQHLCISAIGLMISVIFFILLRKKIHSCHPDCGTVRIGKRVCPRCKR